ncbi:dethiobiotin synthase [bacterium]|nr:MAG: dethiobiotin synthase [bacterium]
MTIPSRHTKEFFMSGKKPAVAVLITSTDLFVGKTYVATGLARALRQRGYSVGVMKPIEIGWSSATDGEWPLDAAALVRAAGSDDPIEDVVPYIFEDLVAPQVAADRRAEPIELERIKSSLDRLRARHDIVLVEGVGGLAVPLDDGIDLANLARDCGMKVIVVTRAHMGTLNLTYLTVNYARQSGLDVMGVIMNMFDSAVDDPTAQTNRDMIESMCGVPVWGVIPLKDSLDTIEKAEGECAECVDVENFIEAVGLPPRVAS